MPDEPIFSDEPLDFAQEDFENWEPPPEFAPPPPAGTYSTYLTEVREPKEFDTEGGKRLGCNLDFRIIGGEYDDRAITWQRVTNTRFERQRGSGVYSSRMLDVIKSAGVAQAPRTNAEFFKALKSLQDRGKGAPLKMQIEWRGFCTSCRDKALMRLTGAANIAAAKEQATSDQYDIANDEAVKAKSHRSFPIDANGVRQDNLICSECGDEVRAQVRVQRYIT